MIIRENAEQYDGSHRVLRYETDEEGKLREQSRMSDLDDQIETFYAQRELEMSRLRGQVVGGQISPIALCMTYQQMTLPDLSARVKLAKRQVSKHLTPEGFRAVTVELLQRYARVFDLSVADLFQFLEVKRGVSLSVEHRSERLIQLLTASPEEEGR